jgi:hypothetical protein
MPVQCEVRRILMPFVVKARVDSEDGTDLFSFHEKTMYRGKEIRVDDEIFVFASDHQGGQGYVRRVSSRPWTTDRESE